MLLPGADLPLFESRNDCIGFVGLFVTPLCKVNSNLSPYLIRLLCSSERGVQFPSTPFVLLHQSFPESKTRLVFSRGFTNDERKEIHNIARRCGFKSKSAGKTHNRQLMVWHKKGSTLELIQHMIQSGGETDLYKLIPPPWCLRGDAKPPRLEDL